MNLAQPGWSYKHVNAAYNNCASPFFTCQGNSFFDPDSIRPTSFQLRDTRLEQPVPQDYKMSGQSSPTVSDVSAIFTHRFQHVSTTVNHPMLKRAEPAAISKFLNHCQQYDVEVLACLCQLCSGVLSTEATHAVYLSFCVDIALLKLVFALHLIHKVTSYKDVSDALPWVYLEKEASKSRDTLTLSELYCQTIPTHGFEEIRRILADGKVIHWLSNNTTEPRGSLALGENPKVAIQHALSIVKPAKLHSKLESDLPCSQQELRKEVMKLFNHA